MEVSCILAPTRSLSRSEGTRKFASFQKSTVVRGSYLLFSRDPIMVDFFAGKEALVEVWKVMGKETVLVESSEAESNSSKSSPSFQTHCARYS